MHILFHAKGAKDRRQGFNLADEKSSRGHISSFVNNLKLELKNCSWYHRAGPASSCLLLGPLARGEKL